MKRGKFERKSRNKRRILGSKTIALAFALVLLVGSVVSGTVAWLTADGGSVTNTFTESDIDITLSEQNPTLTDGKRTAKMIPGWTIDKDPKVTVTADSEDCWLFVKITESTSPDLDTYISYAIATGWETVQAEDANGVTVIGRKVYKDDTTKEFGILGAGSYTDPMGTDQVTSDDFTITWAADEVCVKPSVTEDMMTDIATNKPTLSFQAYAVQLFKTNSNGDKDDITDEFTAAEAWARAADMNSGS